MYILKLNTHFSAAHQLTNAFDKKCNESLHGHNWRVLVKIESSDLLNNMVMDFKEIKAVINQLDHKNLNEILDFEPTAELIARHLHGQILKNCHLDLKKIKISVTVWESENASITYFE